MAKLVDSKELKKIMIDKDIKSLRHLSRLTGISVTALWSLLNKGGSATLYTIQRVIHVLEIDPQTAYDIFLKPDTAHL